MVKIETKRIFREYIITQKEFKELFGIKGDIKTIQLYSGLSPNDKEEGKSHDTDKYEIVAVEEN